MDLDKLYKVWLFAAAIPGLFFIGFGLNDLCVAGLSPPAGWTCHGWGLPEPVLFDHLGLGVPYAIASIVAVSGLITAVVWLGNELGPLVLSVVWFKVARQRLPGNPLALFGSADQGGLSDLTCPLPALEPGAGSLLGPEQAALFLAAEDAFWKVQHAWARQDPMLARERLARTPWMELSRLIEASRRQRQGGMLLTDLAASELELTGSWSEGGVELAAVGLRALCSDPLADCRQTWVLERQALGPWLLVAVLPPPATSPARGPGGPPPG